MLFTSITFLAVFILFFVAYAVVRQYAPRTAMLAYVAAFSLWFFYMSNGWYMLLLPAVALVSWAMTRAIMQSASAGNRRFLLGLTVVADLAPLLYFKYTNFGITMWNQLLHDNFPLHDIVLPIGISFFTFQAISHAVDVYRRKFTQDVSLLEYLFYLSFFPLLLAGPITRAETLFPQMRRTNPVPLHTMYYGIALITMGIVKKAVIADYISQYTNLVYDSPTTYSGFECLMAVIGYTTQIYCDFSGYSDLSIGMAAMMGFRLNDNFMFPYQATNLSDFWRCWHISLSSWFRDYLYIPLGGNRKGRLRTYFNNFITMLVAGLWHGASVMFILWGAIHGLGLVIHKSLRPLLSLIPDHRIIRIVCWIITYGYVAVAWTYFRADNTITCSTIFHSILHNFSLDYVQPFVAARPLWCVMMCVAMLFTATRKRHYDRAVAWFIRSPWIVKAVMFVCAVQLAIQLYNSNVQPFIYYQF